MDRTSRQKVNKDTEDFHNINNQLDLTDILIHSTQQHHSFQVHPGHLPRQPIFWAVKSSLNKFIKIQVIYKMREWHGLIYTTKCKINSQWEAAAQHRDISSVLCDHLEGWDREGEREMQEGGDMGIHVYVQLIHFAIKQKLKYHCKAIILQ